MNAKEITLRLGGCWHQHYGNAPCPVCQPERRKDQDALSLKEKSGRLLVHCHKSGCGFRSILEAIGVDGAIGAGCSSDAWQGRAYRERNEHSTAAARRSDRARRVWDEAHPIGGTISEKYLRSRGIDCPLPSTLRFHPSCWHGATQQPMPAMIALVQGTTELAIHRTYLRPDGLGKAETAPAKAMLGPCRGGAVRLIDKPGPLVVAEGIETALSLACGLLDTHGPIWSALSAGGMGVLNLPAEPGRLIIAPDGEYAGRAAAVTLGRKASRANWDVEIVPIRDKCDWNDILMEGAAI